MLRTLKSAITLTALGYLMLFVSLASTVCPPATHLPLICILIAIAFFLSGSISTISAFALKALSQIAVTLLVIVQLLPLVFIVWALAKTPAGQL
jgi:hypothetical protein